MQIGEREISDVAYYPHPVDPNVMGWFLVRQPAVVRFFESRLSVRSREVVGVGLQAAWRMCQIFERKRGLPAPRITVGLIQRAFAAMVDESIARPGLRDGIALRQPAICEWIYTYMADSPHLSRSDSGEVCGCLFALAYALDELTCGRSVP